MSEAVFVFGSNLAGIHGAGAARHAWKEHGAVMLEGMGHHGNSYAIPTKGERIETLPLSEIAEYVLDFQEYARYRDDLTFKVTQIGCGLAGFKASDIAPMFIGSPGNCQFDTDWKEYLGNEYTYWGNVK